MAKQQINFRASPKTANQIKQLMRWWGETQTNVIAIAIDRVYESELARRQDEASAGISQADDQRVTAG